MYAALLPWEEWQDSKGLDHSVMKTVKMGESWAHIVGEESMTTHILTLNLSSSSFSDCIFLIALSSILASAF